MNWLKRNRLILQLLFTLVAAACLCGISAIIITDAIRSAESVVLGEANKTLTAAVRELQTQHDHEDSRAGWSSLPSAARDVSLRAMTYTVLRSYPGVEGGFFSSDGEFLGYAFPTHDTGSTKTDVPAAERGIIVALATESLTTGQHLQQLIRGKTDLVVLAAVPTIRGRSAIWVMKRLPGRARSDSRRIILLGILIAAALISIGGTLATGVGLARGVAQIRRGLASLEQNFDHQLPERQDELGTISRSINKMAAVRRKLESNLRREDRLRIAGSLASSLAHEIRNPLNSIRLTVQLMEHRLKNGRLRVDDLQTVQKEVDRLSALLNDLLDLQRNRQPTPEVQPVRPIIEHCVALLERQAEMQDVRVKIDAGKADVLAAVDRQQLTQAVVNLLLNALEASRDSGEVSVAISEDHDDALIEIRDNGRGLDAEQQEHLFEPFYTTKVAGTGLGLPISRELIRHQGGDLLYIGNTPGACFSLRIPKELKDAPTNSFDR